jgi:hypothetical protein
MKKNNRFSIAESHFISVVIPSLNGKFAKLLLINENEFNNIKQFAESNKNQKTKIFALYAESDLSHQIYHEEMGGLTKKQFDEILKYKYNLKIQKGMMNQNLKTVA